MRPASHSRAEGWQGRVGEFWGRHSVDYQESAVVEMELGETWRAGGPDREGLRPGGVSMMEGTPLAARAKGEEAAYVLGRHRGILVRGHDPVQSLVLRSKTSLCVFYKLECSSDGRCSAASGWLPAPS